jgi:hypothetical protein
MRTSALALQSKVAHLVVITIVVKTPLLLRTLVVHQIHYTDYFLLHHTRLLYFLFSKPKVRGENPKVRGRRTWLVTHPQVWLNASLSAALRPSSWLTGRELVFLMLFQ